MGWQDAPLVEEPAARPAWMDAPLVGEPAKTPAEKTPAEKKPFYAEGYLGRAATVIGETAAGLSFSSEEKAAEKKAYPKEPEAPTPSVKESLSIIGKHIAEHPLDAAGEIALGIVADPQLMWPALWKYLPAQMAARMAKAGTVAKVAETTARGAVIGATTEAGVGAIEGDLDVQKTVNTGVLFGVMGGVTHAGIIGVGTAINKGKGAFIKDAEVTKPISSEYAESKIKPEESIQQVLTRKNEREDLIARVAKQQEEQAAKTEEASAKVATEEASVPKEEPTLSPEEQMTAAHTANESANKARMAAFEQEYKAEQEGSAPKIESIVETPNKPPLASTAKDGTITLNEPAIVQDFKDGFKYIFDPDSPTGYQKQLVFENIGLSKEEFTKLITTEEKYKTFIRAHEESHLRNNDHPNYPRTTEGKIDLLHKRAIDIESRATVDALKEVGKASPEEIALQNVLEHIVQEQSKHSTLLQGVTDILAKSANTILAKNRTAEIYSKSVDKAVPNNVHNGKSVPELQDKMTRTAEADKPQDRLLTDPEKHNLIYGTGEIIPGTKYKDEGLVGRLGGMHRNIAQGRTSRAFKGTLEEYIVKAEALDFGIRKLIRMGSEEHAIPILKDIEARLAEIGDRALKLGLLEGLRTNYVPHVLDWSKSTLTPVQKKALLDQIANAPKDSKLVRDFTANRKFEFLRELEKLVEGTGVVVITQISKVVLAYEKAMETAIIHKAMFDYLKTNKAPDGKPWVVADSLASKEAGYVSFEGTGTRVMRELRVHPDLVDSMNFLFRQTDPNVIIRTLGGISHLTKAINVVGSLFHFKSLMEAGALTAPGLFLKEVGKELMHLVFKSGEGSGARQTLKEFVEGGNEAMINLYLKEGLMVTVEDVQKTIVAESGQALDNLARFILPKGKELKLVQHITDPLDKVVLQRLNKLTWDYAQVGQKLNVAFHLHQKMKLSNPDMSDTAIAKEVSAYVNNTFGGLNWLEVSNSVHNKYARAVAMKINGIAGREWAQLVLFAPDWTVSTLRAFTSALPKELAKPWNWQFREGVKGVVNPRTQGDLARRYVVHTALAYTTILTGINMAITGRPIWENKDPTRIEFVDGTSMQAAKHSMEAVHWLMNPSKTLGNKLGFFPKAIFVSTTATAYPSPDAPKLKDTSAIGRAKAVALLAAPFPMSSAIQAPEGEGLIRAGSSMLGAPIYGIGKEELSKAISKGKAEAKIKKKEAAMKKLRGE